MKTLEHLRIRRLRSGTVVDSWKCQDQCAGRRYRSGIDKEIRKVIMTICFEKELYAVYGAEKLQLTVVLEESSLEAGERSRGIYLEGAVNQSRSQRETIKPFPHIRQPAFQPQGHSY